MANLFKMLYGRFQPSLHFAAVFLCIPHAVHSVMLDCMTCSYTFAGDGSTDYQCVDDVHNFTKTSSAACDSGLCTIRTVYANGISRINSIYRGCGTSMLNGCDQADSVYPTCTFTCSTPQCNDLNGDLWSHFKHNNQNAENASTIYLSNVSILSFAVFIAYLIRYFLIS